MIRCSRLSLIIILAAACLGACSKSPPPPNQPAAVDAQGKHKRRAHRPQAPRANLMRQLINASLADLTLRPDQKSTIEAMRSDLKGTTQPIAQARRELTIALADGVAVGNIDHARLDPLVEKVVQAVQANQTTMQESVNKLHATLDPAQRKQLVESIRDKGQRHAKHHRQSEKAGPGPGIGLHLRQFADDLELTQQQRADIRARMSETKKHASPPDRAPRERARAVAEAFVSDHFDAKSLDVGVQAPAMVRQATQRIVALVENINAVLTPAQRPKFAQIIRARADRD